MSNVLVTGGAGYIGSVVAHRLKHHYGSNVVLLDDLSNGHKKAAGLTGTGLHIGSIADTELVERICEENHIDCCVHCAAEIDATESVRKPHKYFIENVYGTAVLVDTLIQKGVKNFVFLSSVLSTKTVNPYGWTKRACEQIIHQRHESSKLSYIILRLQNVAGAVEAFGQWHQKSNTHLIPNVIDVAYGDREHMTVFGDGTARRDYIHVADVADLVEDSVHRLRMGPAAKTWTVGTGVGTSVLEAVRKTQSITGHNIPIVFAEERPDKVIGDSFSTPEQMYELNGEVGFKPARSFDDIIKSQWKWKQNHRWGYDER